MNQTSILEDGGLIPGLNQWAKDPAKDPVSCGVGCRLGLDLALLWLWCRLATAALIRPLAWELHMPCAALKKKKKNLVLEAMHDRYYIFLRN